MAQTKRKRRTKHRGNAAGVVETRGRTGKPGPGAASSKPVSKAAARSARFDKPPTWQGAITRAGITSAILLVVLLLVLRYPAGASIGLAAAMFVMYIPLGYYTDQIIYKRRTNPKKKKA